MKVPLEVAELVHANGRTDGRTNIHDEANRRFSRLTQTRVNTKS